MKIGGVEYRSIWLAEERAVVEVIDQTRLPHEFAIVRLHSLDDAARTIREMIVRGAPLIGATAAYGVALAMRDDASNSSLGQAYETLLATRPTAVNLRWALDDMRAQLAPLAASARADAAFARAAKICDDDVALNRAIGEHGLTLLRRAWSKKREQGRINVMTHCNAGWLATVDWGTALAPIYMAFDSGLPVHVWVSETRPRNQGAALTAWELQQHGVPHTVIVDNAAGHLLRRGEVDLVIVGTDRVAANGDVANKIGTYLKALAARDSGVPFYVAAPSPSIDWTIADGASIPIEERRAEEVSRISGRMEDGALVAVTLTPEASNVANPGFDVTPARLVTGLITERGLCGASLDGLARLFSERAAVQIGNSLALDGGGLGRD